MPPSPTTSATAERNFLDVPSIRCLRVRCPGFITESDMQTLPVGGVCMFLEAPSLPPSPVPCIPHPEPGFYANIPVSYLSDSSDEESGESESKFSPNDFEPPYHGTGPCRLCVTNPDPELEEEEGEPTPGQSIANNQPDDGEQGSSSCSTLFLFPDTRPGADFFVPNRFFRDRANRKLKGAVQRDQIGGVEGTPGVFERLEAQARDGWGMSSVAPRTGEIPDERSTCLRLGHSFILAPWSRTGSCLWEGPSQDCDDRGYLLPNYLAYQERMQRHSSVRSI
ncbi:hypothetical protein B9Z19DRAFT_1122416 [Tuber borchii]|uniref:Uncharacterized protein n=1 Tax=Tuber borchii TaxID=42251 RepID=A0A2T7A0G7_TUBBO|nr:hypothetical protein B9Z19DRAFT_1122416 [Tuber borchii]